MDLTNQHCLIEFFCSFYQCIAILKKEIAAGREMLLVAGRGEGKAADGTAAAEDERVRMISAYLHSALDEMFQNERAKLTDKESKDLAVARYVMAALADEIFILEFAWWGGEYWESALLERKLFNTSSSGERFFVLLDLLLGVAAGNASQKDLAVVFLMAMAIGFKGKYRGETGKNVINAYRQKLLRFIGRTGGPANAAAPLFKSAYEHAVSLPDEKRLSPLSRWYKAGLWAAIIYLVAGYCIWIDAMQPIKLYFK